MKNAHKPLVCGRFVSISKGDTMRGMETESLVPLFLKVRDYYIEHQDTLPLRKRFHFFSRCYLWSKRPEYFSILEGMRSEWFRNFTKTQSVLAHIHTTQGVLKNLPKKQYRIEGMQKFFSIKIFNRHFFRCLFERTIFKGTAFEDSVSSIDIAYIKNLHTTLMADKEAFFSLSTPAVNFVSLSSYLFGQEVLPLSYESLLRVAESVTLPNKTDDLDARIYFYTHAIIGASHFYADPIPSEIMPICTEMVMRVEQLIETHYDAIALDHKCEFLVCAILCGYDTSLRDRIRDELEHSLSREGMFFINTQNIHSTKRKAPTLASMEHTNVLALMAFLPKELL